MEIHLLPKSDYGIASQLLQQLDLPFTDLIKEQLSLFTFSEEGKMIGIGGFEQYGQDALLRSVAIIPHLQKKGAGSEMVKCIEQKARQQGVLNFYLLTTTAAGFFGKKGYQRIERSSAPKMLLQTTEFASLCPDSAVCMKKNLLPISNIR